MITISQWNLQQRCLPILPSPNFSHFSTANWNFATVDLDNRHLIV